MLEYSWPKWQGQQLGRVFPRRLVLLCLAIASLLCFRVAANDVNFPQMPIVQPPLGSDIPATKRLQFELAHVFHHGTHLYPGLQRRIDINRRQCKKLRRLEHDDDGIFLESLPAYSVGVRDLPIERLVDRTPERIDTLQEAAIRRGAPVQLPASDWTFEEIDGPDFTDKETVLAFARMSANAYVCQDGTWLDIGPRFNYTDDFGWLRDGLRGHIFVDTDSNHVVIAIKGTTPAVFDGEGTTTRDKINDNLFFGCCCGQGGSFFRKQACDCMTSNMVCNSTCVVEQLHKKDRYYAAAKDLYRHVESLYEDAEIWLTGHSLGGSVASLVGMTYGRAVITFEAPGDALPASRLGLPTPPGYNFGKKGPRTTNGAFHFGHNADPAFQGTCATAWASCTIGGYSLESVCHTGHSCVYDVQTELGWYDNMFHHKIVGCIDSVYEPLDLPKCLPEVDCQDCTDWTFYKSNEPEPTSPNTKTSVPPYTRTRTEMCETPGWFSCLDKTSKTKTTTTSTSTSTCKTPGWFWCLDPTTTTTKTASTTTITTSTSHSTTTTSTTTTCKTPGWFGCNDPTTSMPGTTSRTSPAPTPAPTMTTLPSSTSKSPSTSISSSCLHPGFFWGCNDKTTSTIPMTTSFASSSIATETTATSTCKTPGWFWGCWDKPTAIAIG